MTTMLEKMALAIYREAWGTAADKRWHDDDKGRAHFTRQARAALQAIREPSEGVADRGADEIGYAEAVSCRYAAETAWTAMIDAILSETPST